MRAKRYWFDARRNEIEIPGVHGYVDSTDYYALLAVLRQAMEALGYAEWSEEDDDDGGHCPLCGHADYDDHAESCEIRTALATIDEALKGEEM
jgi:hypothetical protein